MTKISVQRKSDLVAMMLIYRPRPHGLWKNPETEVQLGVALSSRLLMILLMGRLHMTTQNTGISDSCGQGDAGCTS